MRFYQATFFANAHHTQKDAEWSQTRSTCVCE